MIPAEASNKSSDNPKTILIADDSAIVRAIIRQAIERDTSFVVCAEAVDGTEAVTKAKELKPDLTAQQRYNSDAAENQQQ